MGWSRSGRMIAAYLRDNWRNLPYETGASIAAAVELSEMTVIRFIRQLGYSNLKDVKEALKSAEPREGADVEDLARRLNVQNLQNEELEQGFQDEVSAISEVYKLTALPRWGYCTDLLARSEFVNIVGFSYVKGMALDFATRLQLMRPQARFVEKGCGLYPEILDMSGRNHCLVIVDTSENPRKAAHLAERVRAQAIPLIIVTDRRSNWAYDYTELVLQAPSHPTARWSSPAPMAIALNLLLSSVFAAIGPAAATRYGRLTQPTEQIDEPPRPAGRQLILGDL
ncbi:MurR/RpiR family transcriptional regulator [Paracoccus aminophilus]|nr:SIS domain-containing protein [Paracoccus aminophilus]